MDVRYFYHLALLVTGINNPIPSILFYLSLAGSWGGGAAAYPSYRGHKSINRLLKKVNILDQFH